MKIRMYDARFETILVRFLVMTMLVIVGVLAGQWLLTLFIALPYLMTIMMGMSFKRE